MSTFRYEEVKNPEYFRENRLEAHSDHIYYKNREEVITGTSSFRMDLNGAWKFAYATNLEEAMGMYEDFDREGKETRIGYEGLNVDCKNWAEIMVPGHIQLQGYDKPQYSNVPYPWDGWENLMPGEIPTRFNPVAQYVKYFEVPESMKGMPLYISFQGVESNLILHLNGEFVGYSEDSFTPSEFELTPFIKDGENKLAVTVFKWCASSWCEDQDFFRFSGIYRDVYLYTVPSVHVWDVKVKTLLEDDFKKANLEVALKTSGAGRVALTLKQNGEVVKEVVTIPIGDGLEDAKDGPTTLTARMAVANPKLWSAETPNLYDLEIEVFDRNGTTTEVINQRVGIRRFEIKDSIMYLNGQRIVFKGTNRHEFSSKTGRAISLEETKKDLLTMKCHNINAIRTSHYPNDSKLYALCDELGIYMIDETNLESHGSWTAALYCGKKKEDVVPGDRPEWHDMMIDRANSMYQRDKNHPAILLWSCGNEAWGGKNIFDMSEFFRTVDDTRLVQYEGIVHDRRYPTTSDVESQMYTKVWDIQNFLKEHREKPFICCEYMHAMGNSCGAMHKYTDLAYEEPLYQGGFIWDYIDQTLDKKNRYGETFQAYGGDFEDRPSDFQFSANGICYGGDREPSPKMQEVKFNYQNISVTISEDNFEVWNKHMFTNVNAYDCYVILQKNGIPVREKQVEVAVEPLEKKNFAMPFVIPEDSGEYCVTVSFRLKSATPWAEAGYEIAFGQQVFKKGLEETITECGQAASVIRELCVKKPLIISNADFNLGVIGEDFEVLFAKGPIGMESYRYKGKELFKASPKPNFWRAPVDNDEGNKMTWRYGQWKLASLYMQHDGAGKPNPMVEEVEEGVRVTYQYRLSPTVEAYCTLSYLVYGDGTVQTTLTYDPVQEMGDMPEFGVMFKMDANYDTLEWYGLGPEETYADRNKGGKLGIHTNKVADNMAKYAVPQECGNKTGVRYAKVTNEDGSGFLFASSGEMNFNALPYTPHEVENAMHTFELPPIHNTIIRCSLGQMGVGGDDSWGARVHEEFLLDITNRLEFTFFFKGI